MKEKGKRGRMGRRQMKMVKKKSRYEENGEKKIIKG